jgi:NADH-quinone oxidoreductase subunit E
VQVAASAQPALASAPPVAAVAPAWPYASAKAAVPPGPLPNKMAPATTPPIDRNVEAKRAPGAIEAARDGRPDDLKLIWGVGPKLEKMLHAMGVFHFDQIAAWGETELAWVDQNLEGFKGRASRDQWIPQSAKLATGWRPDGAVGERPKA